MRLTVRFIARHTRTGWRVRRVRLDEDGDDVDLIHSWYLYSEYDLLGELFDTRAAAQAYCDEQRDKMAASPFTTDWRGTLAGYRNDQLFWPTGCGISVPILAHSVSNEE